MQRSQPPSVQTHPRLSKPTHFGSAEAGVIDKPGDALTLQSTSSPRTEFPQRSVRGSQQNDVVVGEMDQ